jgi:hypothetical protein
MRVLSKLLPGGLSASHALMGVCALLALAAAPARADIQTTFDGSGTSASDGRVQDGEVVFDINTGTKTITVTLKNTDMATIGGVSQTLVGVTWTFDDGNSPGTLTLSTTASAAGAVDCSSGAATCPSVTPTGTDFGWGLDAGSGPGGASVTSPNLFAGDGSGKNQAIVTSNIDGSSDGLKSGPHNPYLVGPVTFTFTYTGTVTSIDSAKLYFGTGGEFQSGGGGTTQSTSPEPASFLLLGTVLVIAGRFTKKKLA